MRLGGVFANGSEVSLLRSENYWGAFSLGGGGVSAVPYLTIIRIVTWETFQPELMGGDLLKNLHICR